MVWDIINRTIVIPTQKLQTASKEHVSTSKSIVGSGKVTEDSRLHPDKAAGLYVYFLLEK